MMRMFPVRTMEAVINTIAIWPMPPVTVIRLTHEFPALPIPSGMI